jgi:C4-dicarboxylate-specific signal transduction histidine kinase
MPASEVAATAMVVDWRELERWGLSEARLPPGTEVLFREPTPWQRYRAVVLLTCGVIAAESLLIGLLLLERRRRKRAQVALDEQAAYEQVIANLKADAAEHSLDNGLRRLDDALARLAIYARATAAMLVQRPETRLEPPARILWRKDADATHDDAALSTASLAAAPDSARLEIPLVADGSSVGVLTLVNDGGWTPVLVRRIEAASEIIAAAIASSRVARALEEVKDQVEHMARVALIGELAATMSHELRQPLSAIRANAEAGALLLARSSQDQCEARDIFHDIVADDARAVEVIEGVRRLLRKDDQVAAPVDLNEICREAVRLLNYDARLRHTRLELSLAQTLPSVIGHRIQLQQAVLNLAINGLEAASTSKTERFVVVETESCVDEDEVAVSVRDSGPGIPDDVEPHLFESFFSTKAGGLGLGLVIVRSIAERHHGCVRAENHASGGAVFRMQLPIIDGPSPRVVD